ncbi:hypothetical protein NDN08_001630 [Rhodosorus marinus]|uniref:RING-type domain-containing protein n=1 Tax=Rhodosorus marinus TaxID=101924 RepID=A0AAV8URB9_9RHOD|nr:hypothetical protein NDN08_001630 [Rhodosorus marinus]
MASCPLGYGSGKEKDHPMACAACHGLAFEPTYALVCKCVYCSACVGDVRDCYSCGRDVEGSEPVLEFQEKIDVFLNAHGPKEKRERGMFWLEHAVKHERKGNFMAADARYIQALEAFKEDESNSKEEISICMSKQAEIRWQRLSDVESGREMFKEAVGQLISGTNPENVNFTTMAVTYMKWGALEHSIANLKAAAELFKCATEARENAFVKGMCDGEDVVASRFALANVRVDLGENKAAEELFRELLETLPRGDQLSARGKAMRQIAEERLGDIDTKTNRAQT